MKIENLNDITLSQYLQIKLLAGISDELRIKKELIRIFGLNNLSIDEVNEFMVNVNNVLGQTPEFIPRFKMDGIEYGFIPNLETITAAEWVDIETYQKDEDKAHLLLSIFYRPIKKSFWNWGKTYEIEPYQGTHSKFKDAPLEIYLGCIVFFSLLRNNLLFHLGTYILKETEKQTLKKRKTSLLSHKKPILQKNLVGTL